MGGISKARISSKVLGVRGMTEIPPVPYAAPRPGVSRANTGKSRTSRIDPARVGPKRRETWEIPSQDSAETDVWVCIQSYGPRVSQDPAKGMSDRREEAQRSQNGTRTFRLLVEAQANTCFLTTESSPPSPIRHPHIRSGLSQWGKWWEWDCWNWIK